jgi:hypothetical protein
MITYRLLRQASDGLPRVWPPAQWPICADLGLIFPVLGNFLPVLGYCCPPGALA